jgi:hypothetical protein
MPARSVHVARAMSRLHEQQLEGVAARNVELLRHIEAELDLWDELDLAERAAVPDVSMVQSLRDQLTAHRATRRTRGA